MKNKKKEAILIAEENLEESNPSLFHLYCDWAIIHLLSIDKCIIELSSHSNFNLNEAVLSLQKERVKLLRNNEAYKHAQEIINGIKCYITLYQNEGFIIKETEP